MTTNHDEQKRIRIGNDAIELEFNTDKDVPVPVRITNRLAGAEVKLLDAGFALVLEEGGKLVTVSDRDMRCTGIELTASDAVMCDMVHDGLGLSIRFAYSVGGNAVHLRAAVRNNGGKPIVLRDAVLLQAMTDSAIEGQTSNSDFSLGDAGTSSPDELQLVEAHPLFIEGHLFAGIDWPVAENVVQGRTFRCKQFVGESLAPGQSFEFRQLSVGASTPGELPQAFLNHLQRIRGRETRRASMYFDWLVHGSEGLTEPEYDRLLDYFALLNDKFGIRFDLFCADDGIFETRWATTFDLYRKQHESLFPRGFKRMSERMKAIGMECGAWLGPDGFRETEEDERQRIDTVVGLVREHGIGIIKLDTVVSRPLGDNPYRNEQYMRKLERMVAACREASPDIIFINHRVSMSPYILTLLDSTLWMGAESYPDHFMYNDDKARLFTRFAAYGRGEPSYYGAYSELLEDHGVCFNGIMEGWREELVVQTLGRALMLSPEIYGALFLLPDEDYRDLAAIMKLAEQYRDVLAHTKYDRATGDFIHSDGNVALLCLINDGWETATREVRVNEQLGLHKAADAYRIVRRYPLPAGDTSDAAAAWDGCVNVKLSPFQVCVLEIRPAEAGAQPAAQAGKAEMATLPEGRIERSSVCLGTFERIDPSPEHAAAAELVRFHLSSDPMEAQVLDRSKPSQFAEANDCRKFFRDKVRRECYGIAANAWDGDPTTAWGDSPFWKESENIWRLDIGALRSVARIEVVLAELGPGPVMDWGKGRELPRSVRFEVSADAGEWHAAEAALYYRRQPIEPRTVASKLIADFDAADRPVRYVRMHMKGVLVQDIRILTRDNGQWSPIPRDAWKGNNLLTARAPAAVFRKSFTVDDAWDGLYAAAVVELPAETKVWLKQEVAVAWVEAADGRKWPVTDASTAFPYSGWEGNANRRGRSWTFRLPLSADMQSVPLTFNLAWFGVREDLQEAALPAVKGYVVAVK